LEELDRLTKTMKKSKKLRLIDHTYRPVKIAVLDTGLESHPRFGDDVAYQDFVQPEHRDRVDTTLHGTASVDLILRAYPEAELYVGRVFNNDQTDGETEPARLAEVGKQTVHMAL
jgi:subtilisin family serine protease